MVWLAEHDYLRFEGTILQEALDQVVLSQKAFLILTARTDLTIVATPDDDSLPPSIAQEFHTNISQLRAALKEGSSIRIKDCVSYLLAHPPVVGS